MNNQPIPTATLETVKAALRENAEQNFDLVGKQLQIASEMSDLELMDVSRRNMIDRDAAKLKDVKKDMKVVAGSVNQHLNTFRGMAKDSSGAFVFEEPRSTSVTDLKDWASNILQQWDRNSYQSVSDELTKNKQYLDFITYALSLLGQEKSRDLRTFVFSLIGKDEQLNALLKYPNLQVVQSNLGINKGSKEEKALQAFRMLVPKGEGKKEELQKRNDELNQVLETRQHLASIVGETSRLVDLIAERERLEKNNQKNKKWLEDIETKLNHQEETHKSVGEQITHLAKQRLFYEAAEALLNQMSELEQSLEQSLDGDVVVANSQLGNCIQGLRELQGSIPAEAQELGATALQIGKDLMALNQRLSEPKIKAFRTLHQRLTQADAVPVVQGQSFNDQVVALEKEIEDYLSLRSQLNDLELLHKNQQELADLLGEKQETMDQLRADYEGIYTKIKNKLSTLIDDCNANVMDQGNKLEPIQFEDTVASRLVNEGIRQNLTDYLNNTLKKGTLSKLESCLTQLNPEAGDETYQKLATLNTNRMGLASYANKVASIIVKQNPRALNRESLADFNERLDGYLKTRNERYGTFFSADGKKRQNFISQLKKEIRDYIESGDNTRILGFLEDNIPKFPPSKFNKTQSLQPILYELVEKIKTEIQSEHEDNLHLEEDPEASKPQPGR